ncbi:hypothetical protein ABVK25_010184 [Lepraria finkii]|uniref:Secreted protein n=1 Tax=Lepraria finkii TaxID=1340010 RepID=A0ABR4AWD3_9LECA
MKVNAATLAILAGYIATTSCIPVPGGPSPPEIVALKLTTPTKTSEPDLGPTDERRPPGCRPLEARMPPVVGPKMLTGDNDGPALAYNTSQPCCLVHINSKQSPIENQSSSLQYAKAQSPTGTTNTRISVLSMAMGMMTGSRPACPRCTLGNDSNVVADKPEEALTSAEYLSVPSVVLGEIVLPLSSGTSNRKLRIQSFPSVMGTMVSRVSALSLGMQMPISTARSDGGVLPPKMLMPRASISVCVPCVLLSSKRTTSADPENAESLEKRMPPDGAKTLAGSDGASPSWWHFGY